MRKGALRKMLCAVLLCRLSVGDSSPPKDTVVSGQCTHSPPLGGRGSCRAVRSSSLTEGSAQRELRPPRKRNTIALRKEENPEAGTHFFRVVAVLRGPLFVNTCGNAINSCAQDFPLIQSFAM